MLKNEAARAGRPGTNELICRRCQIISLLRWILLHVGLNVPLLFGRWRLAGKNVVDPCLDLRYEGAETMVMKRGPRIRDLDAMGCEDLFEGRFGGLFEFGASVL